MKDRILFFFIVSLLSCGNEPGMGAPDGGANDSTTAVPRLRLDAVSPAVWPTRGDVEALLTGQGIQRGAVLSWDGVVLNSTLDDDGLTLRFAIPPRWGKVGPASVQVQDPDGGIAARSDLFSYSASQIGFSMPTVTEYAVGYGGQRTLGADVNGDGYPDVVATVGGGLDILINDGSGRFAAPRRVSLPSAVTAIDSGDVNRDGRRDLVVGSSSGASVLFGDGTGGFSTPRDIGLGYGPTTLVLADMNRDLELDLVTTTSAGGNTLLGDGTGAFVAMGSVGATGAGCVATVVSDVNRDQRPDLIVGCTQPSSKIYVGLGDGSGRLGTPQIVLPAQALSDVVVSDVNEDGNLDILAVHGYAAGLSVLLGNSIGGFASAQQVDGFSQATAVLPVDWDRDGHVDLAMFRRNTTVLKVLHGDGKGGFPEARGYAIAQSPGHVTLVDLDQDGRVDVVTLEARSTSTAIRVALTQSSEANLLPGLSGVPYSNAIYLFDANADGVTDVVASGDGSVDNTVYTFLGTRNGWYQIAPVSTVVPDQILAVGDLNRDGLTDLVTYYWSSYSILSWLSDGRGGFRAGGSFPTGNSPHVALADMDGDGRLDLLMTDSPLAGGGNSLTLAVGDGSGRFGNARSFACDWPGTFPGTEAGLTTTDLNRDGRVDVAAVCSGHLFLFLGDGAGGLVQSYSAAGAWTSLSASDINVDGYVDLVATLGSSQGVSVLYGDGQGQITATRSYSTGSTPYTATVLDANRDRWPDVLTATSQGYGFLANDGTGNLVPATGCKPGLLTRSVGSGDLDADGITDLAMGGQYSDIYFCLGTMR